MDIKTAFLNGKVDHEIYVEPPEGYPEANGMVLKLNRSLYGLKQSPRVWYFRLRTFLESKGWKACQHDQSVFMHPDGMYMTVYVDDLLIFGSNEQKIAKVKQELASEFQMSDLGKCSYYLGIHVNQNDNGDVHLHQSNYAKQIAQRFDMDHGPTYSTPMDSRQKLMKNTGPSSSLTEARVYQSMVGSANYGMIETRPDIAEAVGVVSQFSSNPTKEHAEAVERILGYTNSTHDLGLHYRHDAEKPDLHMFVDADWAGDPNTRRSTTGWVAMLSGAAISWASKRQKSIALSTMEAEYIAASEAAKEATWLRNFINELELPGLNISSVPVFIDNESAVKLAKNPEDHKRSKHIDIRHHYIRQTVADGTIELLRVPSKDNTADILTKPLAKEDFLRHTAGLGMTSALTPTVTGSSGRVVPDSLHCRLQRAE